MSRLGIRARLLTAAVLAVTVALCLLVAGFNVALDRRLDADANALLRTRVTSALSDVRIRGGQPVAPESADAGAVSDPVWVFAGTTPIEAPRAAPAITRQAQALALARPQRLEVAGHQTRLQSVAVLRRGRRVGTVVAAVSLRPYDDTRQTTLIASIVLLAIVIGLFAISTRWILRRALDPVAQMTAAAAEWSERDIDRRFGLGPPRDELTRLASTLDDLLARLAAGLRREQRVSAEVSHELRTPLARIHGAAELALRRRRTQPEYVDALESIRQNAERMAVIIDTLMEAARHEVDPTSSVCDVAAAARAAASACNQIADQRTIGLEVIAPNTPVRARVESPLAERILQPLIENACRHARQCVAVRIEASDDYARVSVTDDGEGVPEADTETVFEPGVRDSASSGAGLGLALARRLARAGNGDVIARSGAGGEFVVILPIVT